ncbi:hypothetical protein [Cupriavidus sp. USMAHM13]|uniref:hypothetical protein n=1 Tax=Cupriavidus sp. USMAHM13 TaxID=1389192 RepID=UPI0012EAD2EA|nr:hypothetical protein [Cupriavidus sp. USMAHM13]
MMDVYVGLLKIAACIGVAFLLGAWAGVHGSQRLAAERDRRTHKRALYAKYRAALGR